MALLGTATANAQRLPPIPHSAVYAIAAPATPFRVDTTKAIPPTYWLEGGVIGGVAMGVFTVLLAQDLGEGNSSVTGYAAAFLIGGAVGFPAGALIGGQFPKHRGRS